MTQSLIALTTMTPDSSQLVGYGYEAGTLAIEFKSNHKRVQYHYPNFPADLYAQLEAAESKGSFFYRVVKPMYPDSFIRVPKVPQQESVS